MTRVPDPRRYAGTPLPAPSAACEGGARGQCLAQLRRAMAAGDDAAVSAVLRHARDAASFRDLWDLVCAAAGQPAAPAPGAAVTRIFALPVIVVAAAREPLVMPGTLPDIEAVRTLLERHGVLGATRNFGLGNALVALEPLEALAPSVVYRWTHESGDAAPREIAPAELRVARRPERAHLRFLVGAGVSAAEAPPLGETAATVGAWGMPLARELGRQLAQPGLDLLAIPRPPVPLLRAPHAGRRAQLELAFHLFASNAVREFRSATGDPAAVLSAHETAGGGGELRVSLSSVVDEGALEGYRWPLDALDDVAGIESLILQFLADCRVHDVRTIGRVLPDTLENGVAFIAVRRADALAGGAAH